MVTVDPGQPPADRSATHVLCGRMVAVPRRAGCVGSRPTYFLSSPPPTQARIAATSFGPSSMRAPRHSPTTLSAQVSATFFALGFAVRSSPAYRTPAITVLTDALPIGAPAAWQASRTRLDVSGRSNGTAVTSSASVVSRIRYRSDGRFGMSVTSTTWRCSGGRSTALALGRSASLNRLGSQTNPEAGRDAAPSSWTAWASHGKKAPVPSHPDVDSVGSALWAAWATTVSYTHLTLPTNR